jgi:predicted Zn-dependent protease with MMP-like domain
MKNGRLTPEAIEAMLEDGHPEEALAMAERALESDPQSAELYSLAGWALWDLGDPEGAGDAYRKALEIEPDSPDLLIALAESRFALLDFAESERLARRALEEEKSPEACELLSRLAERRGDDTSADDFMAEAHRLEPDDFPIPYRVSATEFLAAADEALAKLPDQFIAAMKEHLTLMVEPLPALELLEEEEPPLDPGILGLYTGVPLPERETTRASGSLPDHVYLFQRNIERMAEDHESLVREITITLYHEIGHFLGMSEEDLEEVDFD